MFEKNPYDSPTRRFDKGPNGVLVGKIESKTTKGFGFIEPLKGGEPIYFHSTSMQRTEGWDEIEQGDEVSFLMGWDKKNGKRMAQGVRLLSKGTPDDGWLGKVTARVSSLNPKGFGFLSTGRERIYFHSTSLFKVDFKALSVGDDVVFTMGWDRKNRKEMAKLVEVRHSDRFQLHEDNRGERDRDMIEIRQDQPPWENNTRAQPQGRQGQIARLCDKGFGFIKPDDGGSDIYFHRSGLPNPEEFTELKEGDGVLFEDGWDRLKGKPMAVGVQLK